MGTSSFLRPTPRRVPANISLLRWAVTPTYMDGSRPWFGPFTEP